MVWHPQWQATSVSEGCSESPRSAYCRSGYGGISAPTGHRSEGTLQALARGAVLGPETCPPPRSPSNVCSAGRLSDPEPFGSHVFQPRKQHPIFISGRHQITWGTSLVNHFTLFYLFNYLFWLRWVFVAARRLSLVAAIGGYSSFWFAGFSLWWLLLLWSTGSRRTGFSSCGTWTQ